MQGPDEPTTSNMGISWTRYYGPAVEDDSDDECWEEDPRVKRLRANGRLPPVRAGREGLARAIRDFGWELVVPQGGRKRPVRLRSSWSSKDTRDYRKGYPGKRPNPTINENYHFHMNNTKSRPDGDYIDNIHRDWWGDYSRLEMHHGYIQWLFPIREEGMNWHAMELQEHEIALIMENPEARARILRSYEMMLDFYGMKLKDKTTGEIVRSDNWEERLSHLNKSYHNYLRITRILKCLGEFGYEYLKAPFINFVLQEALVEKTLPNTIESCLDYWLQTIVSKDDRKGLLCLADKLWDVEPAKEAGKKETAKGAAKAHAAKGAGKATAAKQAGKTTAAKETGKGMTVRDSGKETAAKDAGKETVAKDVGKDRPAKDARKDAATKDLGKDNVAKEVGKASKSSQNSVIEEDMKKETDEPGTGDSIREDGDGQAGDDGTDETMETEEETGDTVSTDNPGQEQQKEEQHQSAKTETNWEEIMDEDTDKEEESQNVTHSQMDIADITVSDAEYTEQGKDQEITETNVADKLEGKA